MFPAHLPGRSIIPCKLYRSNPCAQEIGIKAQDIIGPVEMESGNDSFSKYFPVGLPDPGSRNLIILDPLTAGMCLDEFP